MTEIMQYLPLLNLLVVPVFMRYMQIEIRLKVLEIFKRRVEVELGHELRRNGE